MDIERVLGGNEDSDASWRPFVFDGAIAEDQSRLAALAASGTVFARHDTFLDQLRDLIAARHPAETLARPRLDEEVARCLAGAPASHHGRWVYYPWSGRLVHLLAPSAFRELRSDRNRNKITPEEQARLRDAAIGVIGLSVGQASALTLALEGVGGRFRLADFDTLSLSNLNRLRAGTYELGVNKAVITARQMFEIDPYLEIEIFADGVTDANLAAFLGDGPDRLGVLIEECDDLRVKILAPEGARDRRIPVVMDTNDRGLLDVERFDLEPDRPIIHGRLGTLDARALDGLSTTEKIPHLLKLVGEQTLSPRLASSMRDIKRTLSSWPQLASGVALGGALVTDAARRVLLGEPIRSGRYYVDVEEIIAGENRADSGGI
ncbi:MAG TPA: ThiF family adenylyltransferase [Stellaceae bacterium]|nr:ThiF family adenylyltransferase [Stellaceae bacterium]